MEGRQRSKRRWERGKGRQQEEEREGENDKGREEEEKISEIKIKVANNLQMPHEVT